MIAPFQSAVTSRWGLLALLALCMPPSIVRAAPAPDQNWPQWRGAERNARVTGFQAPQTWPKQLNQKWKETVGQGDATPALVGEKLYVFALQADDETTLCLDATTAKTLWSDRYPPNIAVSGPASRHGQGPRSSPAVAGGKVVTLGVSGILSCLDAETGKVAWRKEFSKEFRKAWPNFYTATSPIIVDGMAIAHVGGQGQGALMAFDLNSGDAKWKWEGDAPAYSSPVLMTAGGVKQIVESSDKLLVGVNAADGKLLWQLPWAGQRMSYNAATPLVEGDTVIVSGQGRGTKALKIEKEGDSFTTKELWTNPDAAVQFSTPVMSHDLIFGLSGKSNFFCLDAKDGKTLWTDAARHDNFGSLVDAGSVILALTPKGELFAFKPTGEKYEELAKIKVSDSPTYAYPVLAGNRIYIKNQDALTMFTVE